MAGIADTIYRVSPLPIQNLLISTYGLYWNQLRFGGNFQNEVQGFLKREAFSTEEWKAYQELKLRELLILAFEQVPYYQAEWKSIVSKAQLEKFTLQDLKHLPPVEKNVVRDRPEDFLVNGKAARNHKVFHTSGSTGTPIKTYWKPSELQRSLAMREVRSCRPANVSFQLPRATFSGRMVEPNPLSKGPYYRFNAVEKQVYFSAFHLGPNTVAQYIQALRHHKIQWITGYSNSIYQLARLALDAGLDNIPQIKAVITTSEKVTPEMRTVIEAAFSTKVFEEYATVEDLFFVCENEYGQKLISPDAGVLEIVDTNFNEQPDGEMGEVLATGFIRTNQPFIRYRIGDIAVKSSETALCGRNMPVLKEVLGRVEDTVYGPDGRRMLRFHGIFVDQAHIQEAQIVQEKLDLIRVKVVPKQGFSQVDEADIIKRVQQRLSANVHVLVQPVEQIERTKAGKFRAVVSNLSEVELETVKKLGK